MSEYSREYTAMLLSTFMYLKPTGFYRDERDTLQTIFQWIPNSSKGEYQVVQDALKRDKSREFANMIIRDVTWDLGGDFSYMGGALFTNPSANEQYVVFQGTQDGEWVDNGIGMANIYTEQQKSASAYFEYLADKYRWTKNNRIVLAGHSKGGNKAQFTALDSRYSDLIDEVYSFDGQGFSPEAIAYYKKHLDIDYEKALSKMRGVNGCSDYVHALGIQIIPEDQVNYVRQTFALNPLTYHYACSLFEKTGGKHTAVPLPKIKNERFVARIFRMLSSLIMSMDRARREDISKAVMQVIDVLNGGKIVGIHGETGFHEIVSLIRRALGQTPKTKDDR